MVSCSAAVSALPDLETALDFLALDIVVDDTLIQCIASPCNILRIYSLPSGTPCEILNPFLVQCRSIEIEVIIVPRSSGSQSERNLDTDRTKINDIVQYKTMSHHLKREPRNC